jgi:Fe-Mn family superoxide dismutase
MTTDFAKKKRSTFRIFLAAASAIVLLFLAYCGSGDTPPSITKKPLPYKLDALEPYISAEAMDLHYNKHYAGYVQKANTMIRTRPYAGKSIEALIEMTAGDDKKAGIFNNTAQAWNHAFYFKSLIPDGGGTPEGRLAEMIDKSFGNFENFKKKFIAEATGQFGSGWAWLVLNDEHLELLVTANADTPLAHGRVPLFTVDVWEHAYYLDYQNRRSEFVSTVIDKLANWPLVAKRLNSALTPEKK